MVTRIQIRRGTNSEWNTSDPVLESGEFGYNTTNGQIKIGNGLTSWTNLDYLVDAADLTTSLGDYVLVSEKSAAGGVAELNASSNLIIPGASIIIEGATSNDFETTITATDPTADRTITIPNSSGTVVLADDSGNVTISGNLTVSGTTTTIDSTTIAIQNSFVFEGTANDYETTLTIVDPTADRTITLPNVTGTVITTGNFPALTWGQLKLGGAI